ncbi:hypothetical protein GCM10010232_62520 [Streptomyces amakusaensis]
MPGAGELVGQLGTEISLYEHVLDIDGEELPLVGIAVRVEAGRKSDRFHAILPDGTAGGTSFSTHLPIGVYGAFKEHCKKLSLPYNQGLAQSIRLWLDTHAIPRAAPRTEGARRIIMGNQKGGVGKTAVSAGVAQALAERGPSEPRLLHGHRALLLPDP